MQEFLLFDMYQEPNNPMEIGWAKVIIQDDHRLKIDKVESSRSLAKEQVIDLIKDKTLIVKNTGTTYKRLRTYIPDISRTNQPCKRIIGITSVYTTNKNRPADSKLVSFCAIRDKFGITFKHIAEYAKKYGIAPKANGVSDSIMFILILLDMDMIERLRLWEAEPKTRRKKT